MSLFYNEFLSLFIINILILICLSESIETCGGTGNGNLCTFPFIYNGITFNQCTYYDETRPWCSTTNNFDNDKLWGYCECDIDSNNNNDNISSSISISSNHYKYSKAALNNGIIETLIISLIFNDRISDTDNRWIKYTNTTYKNVIDSVSTFFNDSSWNQLTYNFTFIDRNYISNLSSSTITTSQITLESYKFAEQDGYIWCNGICQRTLYNDNNNLYFDELIIIVNDQNDINNPSFGYWSGLGTTGNPQIWILSTSFTAGIIKHEFGHNLGLNHQYTSKYGRIPNNYQYKIGELHDGESIMGGSGNNINRYKENGDFGPCSKDYFGWINDKNIIDITINESNINQIDYDKILYFKLYPYDRADINPLNNDNKIFLIRLSWPTQYEYYHNLYFNRIYIYYRTSYDGYNAGLSVQYCLLHKITDIESGAYLQTFTYDINGDTFKQNDHYLQTMQSFVIEPFLLSLEDNIWNKFVNPYLAELNKINVTVLSKGNGWNKCDYDTFICDDQDAVNNLYIDIGINFIDKIVMDIDYEMECKRNIKQIINMKDNEKYKLIHIKSDELGIYGRGETKFNICPNNTHIKAYIFDKYPKNIPKTIGSIMSFTFIGNREIDNNNNNKNKSYPIKAIQIIQNEESSLHIAEIEIYQEINGTNIAMINNSNINCYSYPEIGKEIDLIDGDLLTYSYSKHAIIGSYDVCIFNEPIYDITEIQIYPRDAYWHRSNNLTLNIYGNVLDGTTYNQNTLKFTDLLYSFDIQHQDTGFYGKWQNKHEIITIPKLNQLIESSQCNLSNIATVPFIHGEFYILLERIDFVDNIYGDHEISIDFHLNECKITQCPINTFLTDIDYENDESFLCERCPNNHYSEIGSISIDDCTQCPYHRKLKNNDSSWCSIEECIQVIITHNNGLYNKIDGIYYNLGTNKNYTIYISSTLNYVILYDIDTLKYSIIDLKNNNKQIANTTITNKKYPFLLNSNKWFEENITHFDDIPNTKIKAIEIIQNANYSSDSSYNILSIAEIEIFSKSNPTINIASISMECYDENGIISELTDNDLSTTSKNDCSSQRPCYDICIFNKYIELDYIIIYPPQNNWRYYRTNDLTIKIYTDYDENQQYEKEQYVIYENRMSININTTINITKFINNKDKPLQIECPYKYSFSCDTLLNKLCINKYGNNWIARYIEYEWICIDSNVLTDDLLNYYMDTNTDWSKIKKSINKNEVNSILEKCKMDYIVNNIIAECYVNNIFVDDITQNIDFKANDEISCFLTMYNENGDKIYFDNLLWSTELKLISNDYYFYPIKGVNYMNDVNYSIVSIIKIPKCDSLWTMSLTFDQTPVSGKKFEIWSIKTIDIINHNNDDDDDDQCIEFNCNPISTLIDNFKQTLFEYIDISEQILTKCTENNSNNNDYYLNTTTYSTTIRIETINETDSNSNNKEINNFDNNNKNNEWIIGLIVGIIIVLIIIIIIIIIYSIRYKKFKLLRLRRNIRTSVVGHESPINRNIMINNTNTIQYISESEGY